VGGEGTRPAGRGCIWAPSANMGNSCARIREAGEVLERIDLDRPCCATMLGGPDRRTLFMLTADWRGTADQSSCERSDDQALENELDRIADTFRSGRARARLRGHAPSEHDVRRHPRVEASSAPSGKHSTVGTWFSSRHDISHVGEEPCSATAAASRFSSLPRAPRVQILEEFVRGEFDLLVPPLGGAVVAGDQAHPVQPPEVAIHKRVARLRLVGGALGQAQVPERVVRKRVRLQERVLLAGARLNVLPTRPENVLVGVDQPLRVRDRVLVQRVGGDPPILTQRP